MPTPARHRDPIVNAAATLFRRRGDSATGVANIVDLAGAPKGSLYHVFPGGRASLAETAVREASRRVADTLQRLSWQATSTAQLLTAREGYAQRRDLLEKSPLEPSDRTLHAVAAELGALIDGARPLPAPALRARARGRSSRPGAPEVRS